MAGEFGMIMERSGDGFSKRVQQQFMRVKVLASRRVVRSESAQTIMLSRLYALDESIMYKTVATRQFVMPYLFFTFKQRDIHMGCGS